MNPNISPLFPRDLFGRLALGIASLFFVTLGTMGAYTFLVRARPNGIVEKLTFILVGELFVAMALFFGCGLVWAVATPRWLESLLAPVAKRLMIALAVFVIPFGIVALWALMTRLV